MFKEFKKALKVPLSFHWSTLILLFLFTNHFGFFFGCIYCSLLILSILFHEYAHVWIAQRNEMSVSGIVIMVFGAAALVEPKAFIGQFKRELKCAIAGPLGSLFLAIVFALPAFYSPSETIYDNVFGYLFIINVVMFLFNLLPIYPLDGGRCLNAILGLIYGGIKAIKISSIVAYILSGLGMILCVYKEMYFILFTIILLIFFTYNCRKEILKEYKALLKEV